MDLDLDLGYFKLFVNDKICIKQHFNDPYFTKNSFTPVFTGYSNGKMPIDIIINEIDIVKKFDVNSSQKEVFNNLESFGRF